MRERHHFFQVAHMGCLVPVIGEGGHEEHNTGDFQAVFLVYEQILSFQNMPVRVSIEKVEEGKG